MEEKKLKTYNPVIDIMRIISILAVIFIHTTTRTLEVSKYDLARLPWSLFLNQASRFAVPLFFMLSGFVLELSYPFHESYRKYIKRRINRIFIPYVFWSAIYYFFVYKQHTISYLQSLITGNASYQLYFLPTLLIFYVIFPFLHKYYRIFLHKGTIISLGILQIIILYYDYYVQPLPFYYPISIALLNYYVFIFGMVIAHHQTRLTTFVRKCKFFFLFTTIALAGYVFWEGYSRYMTTHNYLDFYSQWRPSVLLYTLSLTGLLYYFFSKKEKQHTIIKKLANLSFFVFFIHVIILEIIWYTVGIHIVKQTHGHITEQIWYDPLYLFLTASLSFLIAAIVHKIPLLKKITG